MQPYGTLLAIFALCLFILVGVALPVIRTMKKAIADLDRLADSTRKAQEALDAAGQRMDVSARHINRELEEDEHTAALIDEGEGRWEHGGWLTH